MLPGAAPSDRFAATRYFVPPVTLTFTYAFDQQHWNPPPPSPVESFTCTRSVYSPAVPNVALVVFFPPLSLSMGGPAGSNFTVAPAGWRYTAHFTAIGGGGVNPSGSPSDSRLDRKSTRLNSSHVSISYAVFCLKKESSFRGKTPGT